MDNHVEEMSQTGCRWVEVCRMAAARSSLAVVDTCRGLGSRGEASAWDEETVTANGSACVGIRRRDLAIC